MTVNNIVFTLDEYGASGPALDDLAYDEYVEDAWLIGYEPDSREVWQAWTASR